MNAIGGTFSRDTSLMGITLTGVVAISRAGMFVAAAAAVGMAGSALIPSFVLLAAALIYNWYAKPRTCLKKQTQAAGQDRKIYEGDSQKYRVLVAIANPASLAVLLPTAVKAAKQHNGHIILLHIIVVPDQLPSSAGRQYVEESRPWLEDAAASIEAEGIPVKVSMLISHQAPRAIIETVTEENVNLLVLGWCGRSRSYFTTFGKNIDRVIAGVGCVTLIIPQANTRPFKNILIALTDPAQTVSALQTAWLLTGNDDSTVEVLHVIPRAAGAGKREKLIAAIRCGIARFREDQGNLAPRIIFKTIDASRPVDGIVKAAGEFDWVVLSSTRDSWLKRMPMMSKITQIARRIKPPLIIVPKLKKTADR
jgi:APA family basic amino acid/polyamine antiporter